jgi:hypothetical protein
MAVFYIAIRSVDEISSYDGGNKQLPMVEFMHKCAELLVQLFCCPKIGIFIYFQAVGTEPPL